MDPDSNIIKIEDFFKVPERAADKVKNVVEKVKGGYVLIETRPPWWSGPDRSWTKSPIAKFIFHKPSKFWKIYWMRADMKWHFYVQYKRLSKVLMVIKEDKDGCFWG